jgi:ficolin
MLRATTPSRNVCVPTPVSTDIGVLPVVYNQPQVTYQVDDGPEEIMTTFQNISVREDDYVTFTFCVSNLLPGYTLTFDLAGQEGKTRDGCVKVIYRFNFQVTESVKAKVKYQEHIGCERTASLAVSIIPGDPNDDSGETPIKNVKAIHQPLIPPDTCNKRENSSPRELITLKNGRKVVCDTETDGGGWIIFQHRESGDVDFYRGWHEYKTGFGVLEGDFWFGLKYIHKMCHLDHQCELRIELRYNRTSKFATYGSFSISGEHDNYRLFISGYHGDAGDALTQHNGMAFTTKDKDNDKNSKGNCAQSHIGAWWYAICLHSNLNGKWGTAGWKGPVWKTFTGNNPATFTEMKVRLMSNSDKTSTWH